MAGDSLDVLEVTLLVDYANGVPLRATAQANSYSYEYMRKRRQDLMRRLEVHNFGHALITAINKGLLTEETISG